MLIWKRFNMLGVVLCCLFTATFTACHTMKFEIQNIQHEKVVEDTNWFYLSGWFPTRDVDVSLKCPAGAASIKEQTTFGDGLIDFFTFSIVSPRSVWYYCLPEKSPEQKPTVLLLKEESK